MKTSSEIDYRELIRRDGVHRNVYCDPQVFEDEIARIHGRAWVYVGHESQIPKAGDFVTTTMGKTPVVLVRHQDGEVHVLRNRCGHKGAAVVGKRCGTTQYFRCMYHGWTYKTDGALHAVPQRLSVSIHLSFRSDARRIAARPQVHLSRRHNSRAH